MTKMKRDGRIMDGKISQRDCFFLRARKQQIAKILFEKLKDS
jgi:hypothetical protein